METTHVVYRFLQSCLKYRNSRPTTRLQNLLQVLPAVLVRSFVVVQLLLQAGDLSSGLGALAGKTLVDCVDRDVDEPDPKGQPPHL